MIPDEPYRLSAPPTTVRQAVVERIRAERDEADRVARRSPDHAEFMARAWIVTSGADLVEALDSRDGHTLATVVETMKGRQASGRVVWRRDLVVWQGGRVVAVLRIDGSPV
jgi:hypothetical protein